MQKCKVNGQSVQKTELKQMDGGDYITCHINVVGNEEPKPSSASHTTNDHHPYPFP